jgi:uridine kinase
VTDDATSRAGTDRTVRGVDLDELAQRIRATAPRADTTTIVAVDGPAGSGKTTLADALAQRLDAPVVHMDDLYPGWDGLAEGSARLAEQVLMPLAAGRPARYRRYDWDRGEYAEWIDVPAAPFLIIEGCGAGSRPGAAAVAFLIWMDARHDLRMTRGVARDGESFRPHWERWARQEDALFAAERTRDRADVRIDTTGTG